MENSRFFISVPRFLPSYRGRRVGGSSLGFTPPLGGREKKVWDGKARRGAYFMYYFARRRAWRTLGGGDRVEPTGWFANRTERHRSRLFARPSFALRTPPSLSLSPPSSLPRSVETLHRRGTKKNPCAPSSRGPPPALIF